MELESGVVLRWNSAAEKNFYTFPPPTILCVAQMYTEFTGGKQK